MKTTRNVPRTQSAEYSAGSIKLGYYEFKLHGYETRGASRSTHELTGRAEFPAGDPAGARTAKEAAIKDAWATARAWIRELGELVRTDRDLISEVES